jgi:glycosyltransferase involved in cell wall biosynthesis
MKRQFGKTPIAVIHNGISMPGLEAADFRDESTGISGPVQICTAGRLNPIKGYDHLIRAAGVLVERGLDFQLLIIGDGPLRRQLESQANEMDVSAFVQFLGFDPNPLEVIKRCQIFVLSSLHEGISIALLEALSLGKVAVVTDVGGNREIVTHDVSGLLVTPTDHVMLADALERLIREPKLREALGAAGKEVVRNHFTDVAMADATQELYQKLTKTE